MRYYRQRSDVHNSSETEDWGEYVDYYHELNDHWLTTRQIQVYENGFSVAFDSDHFFDMYGRMCDQPFDENEEGLELITEAEFGELWTKSNHINRPT